MRDVLFLIVAVQVARRLSECRVGPTANDDSVLLSGHLLDARARFFAQWLARHASSDRHHHVNHEVLVTLKRRVGIHLEIGERPALVEHTDAYFSIAFDDAGLAASCHRGDEKFIVVGRYVVHDRHRGTVMPTPVAEDARAGGAKLRVKATPPNLFVLV